MKKLKLLGFLMALLCLPNIASATDPVTISLSGVSNIAAAANLSFASGDYSFTVTSGINGTANSDSRRPKLTSGKLYIYGNSRLTVTAPEKVSKMVLTCSGFTGTVASADWFNSDGNGEVTVDTDKKTLTWEGTGTESISIQNSKGASTSYGVQITSIELTFGSGGGITTYTLTPTPGGYDATNPVALSIGNGATISPVLTLAVQNGTLLENSLSLKEGNSQNIMMRALSSPTELFGNGKSINDEVAFSIVNNVVTLNIPQEQLVFNNTQYVMIYIPAEYFKVNTDGNGTYKYVPASNMELVYCIAPVTPTAVYDETENPNGIQVVLPNAGDKNIKFMLDGASSVELRSDASFTLNVEGDEAEEQTLTLADGVASFDTTNLTPETYAYVLAAGSLMWKDADGKVYLNDAINGTFDIVAEPEEVEVFRGLFGEGIEDGWTITNEEVWGDASDATSLGSQLSSLVNGIGAFCYAYQAGDNELKSATITLEKGVEYSISFKYLGDFETYEDYMNDGELVEVEPEETLNFYLKSGNTLGEPIWFDDAINFYNAYKTAEFTFTPPATDEYNFVFKGEGSSGTGIFVKELLVTYWEVPGSDEPKVPEFTVKKPVAYGFNDTDSFKKDHVEYWGRLATMQATSRVEFPFFCTERGEITVTNPEATVVPTLTIGDRVIELPAPTFNEESKKTMTYTVPMTEFYTLGTYTLTIPAGYFSVDGTPINPDEDVVSEIEATVNYTNGTVEATPAINITNDFKAEISFTDLTDYMVYNSGKFNLSYKDGDETKYLAYNDALVFDLPKPVRGQDNNLQLTLAAESLTVKNFPRDNQYEWLVNTPLTAPSFFVQAMDGTVTRNNLDVEIGFVGTIDKYADFTVQLTGITDNKESVNETLDATIDEDKVLVTLPMLAAGSYTLSMPEDVVYSVMGGFGLNNPVNYNFTVVTLDENGVCFGEFAKDDVNGNTCSVVAYDYDQSTYRIPETFEYLGETYTVTSIAEDAFANCTNVTDVVVPATVTTVGKNAFDNSVLTNLYFTYRENAVTFDETAGFLPYITTIYYDSDVALDLAALSDGDSNYPYVVYVPATSSLTSSYDYITVEKINMVFGTQEEETLVEGFGYYCHNEEGHDNINVTYKRNFNVTEGEEGTWQALFLPTNLNASQLNGTVAQLKRVYTDENTGARFIEWEPVTGTLAAHTPYIYKPKAGGEHTFAGQGAVHHNAEGGYAERATKEEELDGFKVTITGVYQPMTVNYHDGKYVLFSDGNFKQSGKDNNLLKPYRVYLTLEELGSEPAVQNAPLYNVLDNGTDTPTAIGVLPFDVLESGVYYDLQGNKVVNPEPGIYILNGKKVVIK